MKMVMSICAEASGVLHHDASDGAILTPGAIIARIDLEDPNSVQSCVLSPKTFPALGPPTMLSADAHRALTEAVSSAEAVLEGFAQDEAAVVEALRDCLEDPLLPALQAWGALTPVEKRIPAELVGAMKAVLGEVRGIRRKVFRGGVEE